MLQHLLTGVPGYVQLYLLVPVIMAGSKFQTDSTLLNLCVFLVILVDVRKHVTIKSTGNNFFLILCDEQVECNCVCVERNPCKLNWNGLNFSNGYISYVFSSRLYFCRNVWQYQLRRERKKPGQQRSSSVNKKKRKEKLNDYRNYKKRFVFSYSSYI